MFSDFFLLKSCFNEIAWKNIVVTDDKIAQAHFTLAILRLHTHTLSKCVIRSAIILQQRLHERFSMLRYSLLRALLNEMTLL